MGILAGQAPRPETLPRSRPTRTRIAINGAGSIDVPARGDSPVKGVTDHTRAVFAHAEGFRWDEALMVLVPIVVVAALLVLANSRAKRLRDDEDDGGS
jgi:hypothetical protein